MIPNVGEVELFKRMLYSNSGSENFVLKLFKNNITPSETDVVGTYTEADFTNYISKTLTSSQSAGTWSVPATDGGGNTTTTYGTTLSWTSGSSQTIYGYYVVGASSNTLLFAEAFTTAKPLTSGDVLNLTITLQLE